MEVFSKRNLRTITFLGIICLVTINMQCYGQQWQKSPPQPGTYSKNDGGNQATHIGYGGERIYFEFKLTSGTHSEKADLNHAVLNEFGPGFSVADWNDLKAIPNIDAWISLMRLRNGQTFMVQVNGKFRYSGNRQYFVHFSTTGKPPAGFLVHDKISNKLFLGSWFGEKRNILVINKGGRDYPNHHPVPPPPPPPEMDHRNYVPARESNSGRYVEQFYLTSRNYSEKDDLNRAVLSEFGPGFSVADWNDLKAIPNIDAWISLMRLRNEQSFLLSRNGQFIHSGKRHYNVQYFASGKAPANYLILDQIGNKLYLGSWYDLNEPVLAIKKGGPGPGPIVRKSYDYDFIKLTFDKFSETQNLEKVVRQQFSGKCRVADWTDLKAMPDIGAWISFRGLKSDQTFFVTRNGKFTYSGKRQYFVHYSPTGILPRGFLAHDQIDNQLFLGSWYGEKRQILVKEYR